MKRRGFLVAAAGLVCGRPILAAAEAARVHRIGFLDPVTNLDSPFGAGLRELGYVEGRNLVVIRRFAESDATRFPALAADLVAANVDVIVSGGTAATQAAQKATSRIPIVGFDVSDPVASGMTTSLARPSANVTGVTNMGAEVGGKRLDVLRALVPRIRRVGFFFNLDNPVTMVSPADAESYRNAGIEIVELGVRRPEEIEPAFRKAQARGADAVLIQPDSLFNSDAKRVAGLALAHRLPNLGGRRQFVEVGGLASFGADQSRIRRQTAIYVDRILKGAKPADLPFVLADKFELCLNRTTAAALGVTIPQELLVQADLVVG